MVSWSHRFSHQTPSNVPSHGWDQFPSWVSPTSEKHFDHSVSLILFVPQSVTVAVSFTFYILSLHLFCFPVPSLPSQRVRQSPPSWLSEAACWPVLPTPSNVSYRGLGIAAAAIWFSNAVLFIFCWKLCSVLIEKKRKSFPFYWYTYYTEDWIPQGYCHTST